MKEYSFQKVLKIMTLSQNPISCEHEKNYRDRCIFELRKAGWIR